MASPDTIVYQGYVLKKRRKKMQGFARRWFILYNTGILEYSFDKGQPVRDQVSLHHSAVSTAPGRKDIHIDSSSFGTQREHANTFHIRCLSTDDFEQWMAAFRRFIGTGPESRRSTTLRLARQGGNKSGVVLEEMSATLTELEAAFNAVSHEASSTLKPKGDKEKDKHKFGLFKRSSHHSDMESREAADKSPAQRVQDALEILKAQHAALVKSIHPLSFLDTSQSQRGSPLLVRTEEEPAGLVESPSPSFSTAISRKHASILTTTTSENEWFDADDEGAEEFILDVPAHPDSRQPSNIVSNDSRSSLGGSSSDEADTQNSGRDTSDPLTASQIPRRTSLPAAPIGDEGSLFTVLKKNVGKDLSTIAVPITFNEPLTLLQRTAEEAEYSQSLLNLAAATADPVERFCYVAAFSVSSYAHTRHRSGRKGFNPMLGETFEDARMKFIAEKVRHQPLEMAYHAEGPHREWELYGSSAGKTKFWGKSLEIIPLGTTHLKIGDDHFEWKQRPSSFMRNLIVGTKYLEHVGNLTIENTKNGARCSVEFKPSGYWQAANTVSAVLYGPSGQIQAKLEGKWDDQLSQMLDDDSHFRILWRAAPYHTLDYYGFTSFGITLNEITTDMKGKLPPTDSRLRPDVRALEDGRLEEAEEAKIRVEEAQRERRRKGMDAEPRWFALVGEEWKYTGGYWEARANAWKGAGIKALW